ncbi:MAG: putative phage related protein [Xanthobacteraceae bacterium]|jgi:predicted translin family RNA/ssDNA-binding protein|nr:putative phage related protein [Xanthobacteraceae bacterium]
MIGFALGMLGAIAGIWWRIETRIEKAKEEALKVAREVRTETSTGIQAAHAQARLAVDMLAEHKIHAAETYVTRDSVREMKDEIMGAVRDMKAGVDHLNERLDRVIEGPTKRVTPRG